MSGRLQGKRALITGAAQGIGRHAAELFAAEGAEVIASDLQGGKLEALQRIDCIETALLDVTDAVAIATLAERLGAVDVLFNCAGYVHQGDILSCPEEEWQRSFAVNVTSAFAMSQAFLPAMLAAGGGSIVNMASAVSSVKGVPSRCAYGASKAAVIGLTKSIAADYVAQGIRCNALCPGTVDTPSLGERIAALGDPDEVKKGFVARQPMGRLGQPQEVAQAALYLASDEAAFVTGTTFVIDGGMSL
ncbi:MAG: SDR family oxidoreductase [Rhodovibrionaceae bacterium]